MYKITDCNVLKTTGKKWNICSLKLFKLTLITRREVMKTGEGVIRTRQHF